MPVKVSGWGKGSFSNQNIGHVGEVGGVESAYLKLSFIKEKEGEKGSERKYLKQRWLPAFPNKIKTHKTLKRKKEKKATILIGHQGLQRMCFVFCPCFLLSG